MYALHAGGNVDDRRIGIGASMYYPVAVEGALVSMGDAHSAQGDSEFDGKPRCSSLTCLQSLTNACVNACVNARQDKTRHLSVRFHPVTRLGCSQCTLFPQLPSTQPAVCLH